MADDLGAIASTPSGTPGPQNAGTFSSPETDEMLTDPGVGAMGGITSDITTGPVHMPNAATPPTISD